jgi:hypothetical protein
MRVDQHVLRIDPEDVITITWTGHVAGKQVRELYTELRRIAGEKELVLYVADLTRLTTFDMDTRRASAELLDMPGLRGIAVVETSFQARVVVMLTIKLIRLLGKLRDCPIVFFPSLEEARVWIDARRRALTATP